MNIELESRVEIIHKFIAIIFFKLSVVDVLAFRKRQTRYGVLSNYPTRFERGNISTPAKPLQTPNVNYFTGGRGTSPLLTYRFASRR